MSGFGPAVINRRLAMLGAAATFLSRPLQAFANMTPASPAVIDWAAAETLLTIGITPAGIADLDGFRATFRAFADLPGVADLGSTWEPNLEYIDRIKPDAIYLPGWSAISRTQLESIAPVRICNIHGSGGDPVQRAKEFSHSLLSDYSDAPNRNALIEAENTLASLRDQLPPRRVVLINLHGTNRFVNVYAAGSLPSSVAIHSGLQNAWSGSVNGFGFSSVGIERLMSVSDAAIVILNQGVLTANALKAIESNALWSGLPAVREGRVHVTPPVSIFGGMASAAGLSEWFFATFGDAS